MKQHSHFRIWMAIICIIGSLLILWLTRSSMHREKVFWPVGVKSPLSKSNRMPSRVTPTLGGGLKTKQLDINRGDLRRVDAEINSDGARTIGNAVTTGSTESGRFSVTTPWTLEVLVTDRVTRMPLGEAIVSIEPIFNERRIVAACMTDSAGRCQVKLGPGTFAAAAEHTLYHRDTKAISRPLLGGSSAKVELAILRKVRIHGVVQNQVGEPVPRAEVGFNTYPPVEGIGWFGKCIATSDEDGRFECHVIEGQFAAYAYKTGHMEWTGNIFIAGEDPPPVIVTLEQTNHVFRISGNVVDQLKRPIPGAEICVEMDMDKETHCVTYANSDSVGFYSCDVERGKTTFLVKAKGFDERRAVVDVNRDIELDFDLKELPSFKVRVLDWNGKTVTNVRLHGTLPDGSWRRRTGRWIFGPGREPNTFDSIIYPFLLHVNALDSGAGIAPPILVRQYRPEITVQLEQGGHIVGRVVNADYEIVMEFGLNIDGPDGILWYKWCHSQDGSFRLDNLPPGDYWITVEGDGPEVAAKLVSIDVGQTAVVEVVLEKKV